MLNKCREELISTGKANLKRMCSIKKEDPDCTDWKFFMLPDYEEEYQCEVSHPIDNLMSELRKYYYRVENIENIASSVSLKDHYYSKDGRSLFYNGKLYTFTTKEAHAISILYEEFRKGVPEVSVVYLTEEVSPHTKNKGLKDIFQTQKDWKEIIAPGKRKGLCKLKFA